MTVFADSSALVKLYADEEDADVVRALTNVVVCALARVEVPAALWRKQRMGDLDPAQAQILTAAFEADIFGTATTSPAFTSVEISSDILDAAAGSCATHGLRAYDAVQLSTALAIRRADPACTVFAAFDRQLRHAAAAEKFALVP